MKKKYFQESDFLKARSLDDPRLGHYIKFNRDIEHLDDYRTTKTAQMVNDVQPVHAPHQFSLYGYASDLGIRLNSGRPGASLAPESIRKVLYKTTPPLTIAEFSQSYDIADYGDYSEVDEASSLSKLHECGAQQCLTELNKGRKVIALGGGHDFGYCEAKGFLESHHKNQNPLVINFDAHLDVRPAEGPFHSGTPFRRMLEGYGGVEFIEVGLQKQCNSVQHLEFAHRHHVKTLFREDQIDSGLTFSEYFFKNVPQSSLVNRPVFLSVDIDVFSQASAPGCSASWPLGVEPLEFFQLYRSLIQTANVRVLGIYEVSPHLDLDNRTSRLASQIIHSFIFSRSGHAE